MRKRLHGEKHPDVAKSLHHLAYLCECQGRYDEADTFYNQALEIFEGCLGTEHSRTIKVRENLERCRAQADERSLQNTIETTED